MKILFFAPHTAIWIHAFPEALVAEALKKSGNDVVYITCGRQLRAHCVCMSAHRIAPTADEESKTSICRVCDANSHLLRTAIGLSGPSVADLIGPDAREDVEAAIAAMTREQILTLEREGIAVGRLALYQMMLLRKRIDLDFSNTEWEQYLVELRNTLYAWHACRNMLDRHPPDRVVVYNALYSVNRVCCLMAEQRGIPHYFMHAGGNLSMRLQTLMLGRGDTFTFMPHCVERWKEFANIPCNATQLALVTEHYLELLRGRSGFVYSSKRSDSGFDARKFFGVLEHQKLLVATLGSYDEEIAAEIIGARSHDRPPLFPTQIEWVKELVRFAATRTDLFLLIRVHPRELPNRRDGIKSQHAMLLEAALTGLPENVAVNWPSDGISMYDLADHTDVFLNSWSSVGKEMSILGIPVVLYSEDLAFYPSELNHVGTTLSNYLAAIDAALVCGWSFECARKAFRWGVLEFVRAVINIADSFSLKENEATPVSTKIMRWVQSSVDPQFKERSDLRGRAARLKSSAAICRLIEAGAKSPLDLIDVFDMPRVTLEEESLAIRKELGRLANALFPTPQSRESSRLYRRLRDAA